MYYFYFLFRNGKSIAIDLDDYSEEDANTAYNNFLQSWADGSSLFIIQNHVVRYEDIIYANFDKKTVYDE